MAKKADVNAVNEVGETPLHSVVFNPSVKILLAKLLLENNANPNAVIPLSLLNVDSDFKLSEKQESPLHFAVRIGRTDVVKLLVAYGADTTLVGYALLRRFVNLTRRRQGLSPVGLARKAGFEQIADLIRDAVELQKFLEANNLSQLTIV